MRIITRDFLMCFLIWCFDFDRYCDIFYAPLLVLWFTILLNYYLILFPIYAHLLKLRVPTIPRQVNTVSSWGTLSLEMEINPYGIRRRCIIRGFTGTWVPVTQTYSPSVLLKKTQKHSKSACVTGPDFLPPPKNTHSLSLEFLNPA